MFVRKAAWIMGCLWAFAMNAWGSAPEGYRIEVALNRFDGDTVRLAYYYGKSQYLKDTAVFNKGTFVFEGDSSLKPGVYLLVLPPDNQFIHLLIPENEQRFTATFDVKDVVPSARFKGSAENELYYGYLRDLEKRRPRAEELRKLIAEDSTQRKTYEAELEALNKEVLQLQRELVRKHPATLTAMLIKANLEIELPDYSELPEEERRIKEYEYFKAHYFDGFDLADPRAIRTGLIHTKVDYYINKLTYPYPDSQIVGMDYLLKKMLTNQEAFQYYLVHFLNEAAKSKRMGMDAAYVYLIDEYYAKGLAPWIEQESLDKLLAQAATTRPLLIGKTAPDLTFLRDNGQSVNIHGIDAEYTVLFFWDPECGHCKKSIPSIIDFYNEYKSQGVEILAICTKTGADISSCWNTVKERGMDIWVNAADQYLRNRYKTVYDIKTTPQIFILDKDKKIIVKKIAGEDLKSVMEDVLKLKGKGEG